MDTIAELLAVGEGSAPAIETVEGDAITYAQLRARVQRLAGQLRALGLGSDDRVAILLPNGPDLATAVLAAAACATAAPLNPAYRADELRFYLEDLRAHALITDGVEHENAPRELPPGTRRLVLGRDALGPVLLEGGRPVAGMAAAFGESDDVALALHTSGTTSRPKLVPLTQRNLVASAQHVRDSLELTDADRALNVMPLFHIHGLVASVLATFAAGGTVVCAPGFDAFQFTRWLRSARPTWYSAVPTIHQAVLRRTGRGARPLDTTLRLIRSSSSALPPSVMAQLEATFGVPVIEAYGMTEAAHQMATNPLPPGDRHPGSVGRGAGVRIAIMDTQGALLPAGTRGEVVVAGPNVMAGYAANPDANAAAFCDGWLRTGDEGYVDASGYLYLTGRLKELINRGGEKIAPREIDEALLNHPAVEQAVAFAVPHAQLGEDVGVAIVLVAGRSVSGAEVRAFLGERLAAFKVPRHVVFVDAIPKGPTGKLQRIGLAERLGIVAAPVVVGS